MDIKNDHRYAINLNVRGIQPSATLRINELSNQLRSEGKDIIKLGLGSRRSRYRIAWSTPSRSTPTKRTICRSKV